MYGACRILLSTINTLSHYNMYIIVGGEIEHYLFETDLGQIEIVNVKRQTPMIFRDWIQTVTREFKPCL